MAGIRIKRIYSQISSNMDWLISLCVNHESLLEASLLEVQQQFARASIELRKMRKNHVVLNTKQNELQEEIGKWKERAKRLADNDREKALQCIKKYQRAEQRLDKVSEQVVAHGQQLTQMEYRVEEFKEKIEEFKRRRSVLKLNSHRYEGSAILKGIDELSFERTEALLDEWEVQLSLEDDFTVYQERETSWEKALDKQEEEESLEAELVRLLEVEKE